MTYLLTALISALSMLALYHATLRELERALTSEEPPRGILATLTRICASTPRSRRVLTLIQRLKQSDADHQTRYKILANNVPAAVVLHEANGTILWCSSFTEVVTGFALSQIYQNSGSFLRANLHDDDREALEKALKIVATGEPYQFRSRFYHKAGRVLWLETRTVPILDESLEGYVALSIMIDVTAQVMTQAQLEERNRDLNEFTYMLSHDLKAPLLTISGMLDMIETDDQLKLVPSLQEPLSYINRASRRLGSLVQGVLELARVSTAPRSLEPVPLDDVIREVIDEHRLQIDASHATVTTVTELPVVLGDRTQLYQALSNLVGNALKYRDGARALTLSINSLPGNSPRKTSILIRDNGRGIAHEHLEQIFRPFARAGEEKIEGNGVGLASAKRLIEKLGGSITVESAVGEGTTFTIELRKAPDPS